MIPELPTTCNQEDCDEPAVARFTKPGGDEACICIQHEIKLRRVAAAIGVPIQIIPLPLTSQEPSP